MTIRDRAAIVGIGQTPFAKHLGRSEYDMAVEAILAACDDAGISPRAIDGVVRYDMETTDEENLLAALGNPCLRSFACTAWGGGGAASTVVLAAQAIAAGMATTVLVYRSRARGKQSVYGRARHLGGRYWERLETELPGLNQWHVPHGLVSASEWTGVPLSTLLRQTGLKPGAAWVLAEGADAAVMSRSVPIDKCLSDALIVFAQNGEAIRPEQGYPMRLFLPGWEGNMSIKWLRRLEVSDKPYYTREETSKYTDLITTTGKARIFTFTMEAKSVITFPSGEMKLPGVGFYEITGLAWSGRGKIARVEVSTDSGKRWNLATLQDPVLSISQTRFGFPWIWDGTPAVLQSRATDETGYSQPTHQQLIAERGPLETGAQFYHMNAVQSWGVATDGSVKNVYPVG